MSDGAAQAPANNELEDLRSQLDAANRKLAEAHKMASLGRLAAGIVHEINTPIGSILSNNETVRRSIEVIQKQVNTARDANATPPPKVSAILETVGSLTAIDKIACERIQGIVRSLKTFARVSESDLRTIDLRELLVNTIKLVSCSYRRRIEMETDFPDGLPDVECFPGLMSQVFLNLVVNAAQAIPDEGKIKVSARADGGHMLVSVADNGSGIPEPLRPKIFSAGFTTKPVGEGTGLGLAITHDIVVGTHGGSIGFESEMGKGTTFHVRIPLRQPKKQEQA